MGNICRKDDVGGSSDGGVAPGDSGAPAGDGGLDTQPPAVSITTPANGAQVAETTKVVVQATDDHGVAKVELLVDGTLVASQNATPYEFPISLQPGAHTLTAVARDAAGNQGQATVNVTVGGAGPAPQTDSGAPAPQSDAGVLPGAPGTFGAKCTAAADCTSKICASDPEVGESYCSQPCGAQGWCPPGGVCVAGSGSSELCALELASDSGGCAVGRGSAPAGWPLLALLGLIGLLVRRD